MSVIQYQGTGKRKTSVARVFLRPGKGIIKVNRREFEVYFPNPVHRMVIQSLWPSRAPWTSSISW